MAGPADQSIGANLPPLDPAERVPQRLDLEHIALLNRAMALEMEALQLPDAPQTDEEAAKISDHVVERRKLAKEVGELRLEASRPYRDATGAVNDWFNAIGAPAEQAVKDLTRRVGAYNDAKAARLRAEQQARQREEEAKARAAREEADKQAAAAREAEARAAKAKADMEAAHDDQQRRAAEKEMRANLEQANEAAGAAAVLENRAEMAEDTVGALERAAARPVAGSGGAQSATHGVTEWTFSVTGHTELMASLGPLGKYLGADAVNGAIRAAIREGVRAGIPGVMITETSRTVIRQSKTRS